MSYLSWSIFVEGSSDADYLAVLSPRLMGELVLTCDGPSATIPEAPVEVFGLTERRLDVASDLICGSIEAFHIIFVHGDTGSPAQQRTLQARTCRLCELVTEKCNFMPERCVVVAPKRETEAWCLADKKAIRSSLGLSLGFDLSFVPEGATLEGVGDPKQITAAIQAGFAQGRRRSPARFPYTVVAQRQRTEQLRRLASFRSFETSLKAALRTLGYPNLV